MKKTLVCLLSGIALSATAVPLQLHSQIDPSIAPSASAGGDSSLPVVSADGRFVLFASMANNLAAATNNRPYWVPPVLRHNVYLRDRAGNTTVLASVSVDGTTGADQDALPRGVSTNGQFVLFESTADNLTAVGTNNVIKVIRRDVINGTNFLVSVNTNGVAGNGDSFSSVMTPDGRFVAFASAASDLVPGDTNGIVDVFVCDVLQGTVRLVSFGAKSTNSTAYFSRSDSPVITPDGRYAAFYSSATNLVPGQALPGDVYLRDLVAGTTTWVSAQARAQFQAVTGRTNAISCNPCLSDDGNYVAFLACTNAPTAFAAQGIALRYSRSGGQTVLVNTNCCVPLGAFESIQELDMTPDGRFIASVANAAGAAGTNTAVYLWDAQTGVNTLVSADTNNALPAAAVCDWPLVSSDGRYVTFLCSAGLTTNTAGTGSHVYRRDVVAGVTVTVDTETNGADNGDDSIVGLSVSDDGQIAAFDSTRPTMATADGNGDFDVFVRDLGAGTTELISARQLLLPSVTPNGISRFGPHALSQDGRVLAFSSEANNLVPGDTNQFEDVFARDLHQGTTVLASVGLSGAGASGPSCQPAISGNGQFVAFTSRATNLVAGYANNGSAQIFLRDLQAGVTTLVTVNRTNTGGGNADSEYPVAGYDGRFILFSSYANNLSTASYTSGSENFFLHDQQVGTNYALTTAGTAFAAMTPDGHYVACADNSSAGRIYVWDSWQARRVATNAAVSPIAALSISRDGNRIACFAGSGTPSLYLFDRAAHTNWVVAKNLVGSHPGLKFSADGNCLAYACAAGAMISNQVYVCNIPAQTNVLVSHAAGSPTFGDGQSDWPDISADGRYVAYRSNSGNLVTGGTNVFFNIYLCDTVTGSNTLLSADTSTGLAATRCSSSPVFSGDGRTLIFRTWADNLVANDFNQTDDLLAYAFLYSNASLTNGGNLTLDWPAAPGQTFTVLYANDLANPVWQTFTGPVTTNGYRAFISDATGNSAARFYRVISNP